MVYSRCLSEISTVLSPYSQCLIDKKKPHNINTYQNLCGVNTINYRLHFGTLWSILPQDIHLQPAENRTQIGGTTSDTHITLPGGGGGGGRAPGHHLLLPARDEHTVAGRDAQARLVGARRCAADAATLADGQERARVALNHRVLDAPLFLVSLLRDLLPLVVRKIFIT